MPARIFCKTGELKGVAAEIGAEATLGRSRKATVRLQAGQVSGEHLRIAYDPEKGCYVLEDLGSTNGTALDGVRVRGRERLGHLHVITLAGEHDLIFQDLDLCARRHGAPPLSDDTAIDEAFPVIPEELAEPEAAPSEMERTRIAELPVPMPDFLAGQAEDAAEEIPAVERTRIDELPVALPGILAQPSAEKPSEEEEPYEAVTDDELADLFLNGEDERDKDEE